MNWYLNNIVITWEHRWSSHLRVALYRLLLSTDSISSSWSRKHTYSVCIFISYTALPCCDQVICRPLFNCWTPHYITSMRSSAWLIHINGHDMSFWRQLKQIWVINQQPMCFILADWPEFWPFSQGMFLILLFSAYRGSTALLETIISLLIHIYSLALTWYYRWMIQSFIL